MLYFVHISIPNPPFENKKGALILDFGMVEDPSFGRPTDGGPSPTPPKLGGDPSEGPQTNQPQSGGVGPVVTSEAQPETTSLPPIDPPSSDRPASDNPKIKVDFTKFGKRNGKGGEGDPNGWKNGSGSTGSGKGGNGGGVTGNYGDRILWFRWNDWRIMCWLDLGSFSAKRCFCDVRAGLWNSGHGDSKITPSPIPA